MSTDTLIPGIPAPWTRDDTMRTLTKHPLPATFTYPHRDGGERPVMPSHSKLIGGYGKWLRETPYFRGLFDECHEFLAPLHVDAPVSGEIIANGVNERRKARGTQLGLL